MSGFGDLGELPTVDEVIERVNAKFDGLFHTDRNGKRQPYVCSFCDEFIMCEQDRNFIDINVLEKKKQLFEWREFLSAQEMSDIQPLVDSYKFNDASGKATDP